MIEPVPKELAALIAAERTTTASAALREGVRAKLVASIGSAPLGAAAATSVIKIVTILAIAIGAGTVAVIKSPAVEPGPVAIGPIAHVEPWELAADVPDAMLDVHVESAPAPHIASRASAPRPHSTVEIMGEADLIAAAWAALSARDAARALELSQRDAHDHPNGVLAEECAAITIVALARLARLPEADAAAEQFAQQYPNSIHHELISNALSGDPP